MKNLFRFSAFLIFLLNISKIFSLNTNIRLTVMNSNNTSPVFLGPPISSGGTAGAPESTSHGTNNNNNNMNNNAYIPSQPGTPAAFYPVPLLPAGTNVTSSRVSQPRNAGMNRTEIPTGTNTYLPAQPGIPGAFIPQPLTGLRTVNNSAAGIIPAEFWVKQNGTDYILLKSRLNGYLSCDNGNVTTVSQLINNNITNTNVFWIPETVRANTVTLRSANGGFLILNNSLFNCNGTSSDLNSQFQVRVGLKNDRMRSTDYIAFRIDIGYLGMRDNIVMLIQQLDDRAMFDPIRSTRSTPNFR